jgi:phosphoesterase RecJ-like protein
MKAIDEIHEVLSSPKKIVITHHFNPDADATGSTLALKHYLSQKGHECHVISPNALPDFLQWMPGSREVIIFEQQPSQATELLNQADVLFILDINQFSRTKTMTSLLENFKGITAMIDHHLFPDTHFDYGISQPEKSSTCEMVFDFIQRANDSSYLNLDIAKCLYAGVMTDTGSFKFSSTAASTHRMVAELMELGLDTAYIHQAVFDTYQENRLRFLGYVLSEKMILFPEQHTALIAISRDELNKFRINTGDTEGIVNYPLSIKNIICSIFISERESEIRMSFRSKGTLDVNTFARTYFDGGGHLNAAGGKSLDSLDNTIHRIKQALHENESQFKLCYQKSIQS